MSWPHRAVGYDARIELLPAGSWRCLVRRLPDGAWRSVEPANPGYATPDEALAVAVQRVADLLAARQEAIAVEVVRFLVGQRLRPVTVPDPETGQDIRAWQAKRANATWTAAHPTPQAAVRDALGRTDDE